MINIINNSSTDSSLLILSWNANGLKNHRDEFLITLQEKRFDIALISETHYTNYYFLYLPGFRLYQSNYPDGTAHAWYTYIRSSLASLPLHKFQTNHIRSCVVSIIVNNMPIIEAAIYCPPKHTISYIL